MRTLQEKYNGVLEGNFSKTQFRRDAAIEMPQFVSTVNSFDDTVAILKNKGAITEAKKQEPKYSTAKPADQVAPDVLDTGIKFELDKKYGTLDVTPEQYKKCKEMAIKNLAKDVLYYVKQDSEQLEAPGEKMEKAKLKEVKVNEGRYSINLKAAMDALNKSEYVDGVKIRQGNKFTGIKSIDVNTRLIGDLVVTKDGEVFWPYKDRTWGWDSPSIEHLIKTIEEVSAEEELNPSNDYKLTEVNEDVIDESQLGIFTTTIDPKVHNGNDAWGMFLRDYARNKGVSDEELGKMSLSDMNLKYGDKAKKEFNLTGRKFIDFVRQLIKQGQIELEKEDAIDEAKVKITPPGEKPYFALGGKDMSDKKAKDFIEKSKNVRGMTSAEKVNEEEVEEVIQNIENDEYTIRRTAKLVNDFLEKYSDIPEVVAYAAQVKSNLEDGDPSTLKRYKSIMNEKDLIADLEAKTGLDLDNELDYEAGWNSDDFSDLEEIDEIDRNDPIAMRLRADKMKREKELAEPKRRPLYGKVRRKVEDDLWDISQELKDLYADRRQVLIDMEQEAEVEGGPNAERYGDELNNIEDQIQALIAKRNKLEVRLDEEGLEEEKDLDATEKSTAYRDGDRIYLKGRPLKERAALKEMFKKIIVNLINE